MMRGTDIRIEASQKLIYQGSLIVLGVSESRDLDEKRADTSRLQNR
jgi:hypothetical protein